ncbi:MAG: putative Zn-dependent hydrolase, glyoxylase [Thermomicrobiales bacterium]|nr:putative Zn-dependent hydrolase, glyoxylase [Thermomicrobiales bacterium]
MEIAKGIYSLGQRRGGHVHAFLIDDGHDLTLIDTLADDDARRVLAALRRLGRSPADVKNIVLTHGHRSHLGGLAALKRMTGATVYAHEWESDIIAGERRAQPVTFRPVRPLRTWWRIYHLQLGINFGLKPHIPCPIDVAIAEGDAIGPLQVLHTPGHSPGHLAFYWPERRTLIAGDAIATWPALAPGWPSFNLNPTQERASLRRMTEFDINAIGVGHGEPIVRDAAETLHRVVQQA